MTSRKNFRDFLKRDGSQNSRLHQMKISKLHLMDLIQRAFDSRGPVDSKSRQRRETTICRAAALHPLGYESIRLCATFWDNYCCAFAHLSTSVKQLIKVYACWVRSGRQKYGYLMSVIDDLTHQSGATRSEYCVKRVIRNKSVYEIDTDILGFCFLRLICLRYM